MRRIAKQLLIEAARILGYEYIHDPEHKKEVPSGYRMTEKDWARDDEENSKNIDTKSKKTRSI